MAQFAGTSVDLQGFSAGEPNGGEGSSRAVEGAVHLLSGAGPDLARGDPGLVVVLAVAFVAEVGDETIEFYSYAEFLVRLPCCG